MWDVDGAGQQDITPTSVSSELIKFTLPSSLNNGFYKIAVKQSDDVMCESYTIRIGSCLPDTGQKKCYNESGVLTSCPAEGDEFYGQDAQFGWDAMDVTSAQRFDQTEPVTDQPVVYDKITQLEWQGCEAGKNGSDCTKTTTDDSTMEWQAAIDYCDGLSWGGHDDWRLPTVQELSGIVYAGSSYPDPALDGNVFPGTSGGEFWSSSSNVNDVNDAWSVDFDNGDVSTKDKSGTKHARCLRGVVPAVTRHFDPLTLSGDRVVKDNATGLMWQGCEAGKSGAECGTGSGTSMNWKAALKYCEDLNWGGYMDWVLPDRNQLQFIVDYDESNPSIDKDAFPGTSSDSFWSSSSHVNDVNDAWYVDFGDGYVSSYNKSVTLHARCLRGVVRP